MRSIFKVTNKAEAGRKLVSINQDIQHRVKEFNSIRSLPILLCLEDAINNLEVRVQKAQKVEKQFEKFNDQYFAIVNCITQWYGLIDKMIQDINEKGFKDPSTKIKIEGINFGNLKSACARAFLTSSFYADKLQFSEYLFTSQKTVSRRFVVS